MMKLKLRHFVFFITLIVLVVLIITQAGQLQKFLDTLKSLNVWILLLILPARYLYYRFNTRYFASFFTIFGEKTKFSKLFRTVTAMNFVNIVFPTGGLSGLSYMKKNLDRDVSSATLTLSQIFYFALLFVCLVLVAAVSFVILLLSNQVVQVSSRILLVLLLLALICSVSLVVFVLNRRFSEDSLVLASRPVNFLLRLIRKRQFGRARIHRFVEEFHDSFYYLRDNWQKLAKPFGWICLMSLCDIVSVYIVFLAFGELANPAVVATGYVVALAASIAALVTAGVGVYEAVMITTFVGLGIGFDLAFSVTIVYRTISLWLFMPVGLYLYKRGVIDGD